MRFSTVRWLVRILRLLVAHLSNGLDIMYLPCVQNPAACFSNLRSLLLEIFLEFVTKSFTVHVGRGFMGWTRIQSTGRNVMDRPACLLNCQSGLSSHHQYIVAKKKKQRKRVGFEKKKIKKEMPTNKHSSNIRTHIKYDAHIHQGYKKQTKCSMICYLFENYFVHHSPQHHQHFVVNFDKLRDIQVLSVKQCLNTCLPWKWQELSSIDAGRPNAAFLQVS